MSMQMNIKYDIIQSAIIPEKIIKGKKCINFGFSFIYI